MKAKLLLGFFLSLLFMALVSCAPTAGSSSAATPTAVSGNQVTIVDFAFNPATLTAPVGTTVTWTNNGSTNHTITSDTGNELGSSPIPPNGTYNHTFATAGTYTYHCSIHTYMKGTIIITP